MTPRKRKKYTFFSEVNISRQELQLSDEKLMMWLRKLALLLLQMEHKRYIPHREKRTWIINRVFLGFVLCLVCV